MGKAARSGRGRGSADRCFIEWGAPYAKVKRIRSGSKGQWKWYQSVFIPKYHVYVRPSKDPKAPPRRWVRWAGSEEIWNQTTGSLMSGFWKYLEASSGVSAVTTKVTPPLKP